MFDLASGYRDRGMAAYSELQQKEFAREKDGYTCECSWGWCGVGWSGVCAGEKGGYTGECSPGKGIGRKFCEGVGWAGLGWAARWQRRLAAECKRWLHGCEEQGLVGRRALCCACAYTSYI